MLKFAGGERNYILSMSADSDYFVISIDYGWALRWIVEKPHDSSWFGCLEKETS